VLTQTFTYIQIRNNFDKMLKFSSLLLLPHSLAVNLHAPRRTPQAAAAVPTDNVSGESDAKPTRIQVPAHKVTDGHWDGWSYNGDNSPTSNNADFGSATDEVPNLRVGEVVTAMPPYWPPPGRRDGDSPPPYRRDGEPQEAKNEIEEASPEESRARTKRCGSFLSGCFRKCCVSSKEIQEKEWKAKTIKEQQSPGGQATELKPFGMTLADVLAKQRGESNQAESSDGSTRILLAVCMKVCIR
jgi:hypothetical protein